MMKGRVVLCIYIFEILTALPLFGALLVQMKIIFLMDLMYVDVKLQWLKAVFLHL